MPEFLSDLLSQPAFRWWIVASAIALSVVSLAVMPWLIARLPHDYFVGDAPPRPVWGLEHPLLYLLWRVLRNSVGAVLVLAGVAMLIAPGQGLLTIVVGLALVDIPGKRALEKKLIARAPIKRVLDALRRRTGRRPFEIELAGSDDEL